MTFFNWLPQGEPTKLKAVEAKIADLHRENTALAAENRELREKLNDARRALILLAEDALFEVRIAPLEASR